MYMYVKLYSRDLNLASCSHTSQKFRTCGVAIMARVRSGWIDGIGCGTCGS